MVIYHRIDFKEKNNVLKGKKITNSTTGEK